MNEKIKNIIKDNLKGYTLEKVILFGSRARGDNDEESDYDLYIELKEKINREQKVNIMDLLLGKLADEEICADIIIGNAESFEHNKDNSDSIIKYAAAEGQIL